MRDILSIISTLNRPRLLVQAARFGVDQYRRNMQLPRILESGSTLRSGPVAMQLLSLEAEMNDNRTDKTAEYSAARHIDVLIALMAEAQLLRMSKLSRDALT